MSEEKLTRSQASVPTDRQDSLCFASLPSCTDRVRHWSVQFHSAPQWSLQNLIRKHMNRQNQDATSGGSTQTGQ